MAKPLVLDLHIPYCIRPENYLAHFNAVGSNAEKTPIWTPSSGRCSPMRENWTVTRSGPCTSAAAAPA